MLRKAWAPLLAFLLVEVLYNIHALWPSTAVYNFVWEGFQYVKIDLSKVDPRKIQRFGINLAFAVVFLLWTWREYRALAVTLSAWFTLNAAEVYITGGYFWSDWPDWIILSILLTTWYLWEKWAPIKAAVLRIVHNKWNRS